MRVYECDGEVMIDGEGGKYIAGPNTTSIVTLEHMQSFKVGFTNFILEFNGTPENNIGLEYKENSKNEKIEKQTAPQNYTYEIKPRLEVFVREGVPCNRKWI